MTGFRVALLDVDGTLRHGDRWNPGTPELLNELHDAGVHVALCSGRTRGSLIDVVGDLPHVEYLASSSGASVHLRDGDDWRVIAHRPVPREAVELALQTAEEHGVEVWAFTKDEWMIAAESERARIESMYVGDVPRIVDLHEYSDQYGKVLFRLDTPDQVQALKQVNRLPGTSMVVSGAGYLDLVAEEAHLSKGGDVILERLGESWTHTISMGDSENDWGMLSRAGLAVCIPPMRASLLAPSDAEHIRLDADDTQDARRVVAKFLAG